MPYFSRIVWDSWPSSKASRALAEDISVYAWLKVESISFASWLDSKYETALSIASRQLRRRSTRTAEM